jgi:hypothetical protein
MSRLGRCSCPQQPSRDRRMPDPKDSLRCRPSQSFRQGTQHQCHPMRRRFQPRQRRVQTCTAGRPTCLTAQPLDLLSSSIQTIADQGMDIRIPDPVVSTSSVGASTALSLDPSGCSTPTLDLSPGSRQRSGTLRRGGGRRIAARRTIEGSAWLKATGQSSASYSFGLRRFEREAVPLSEPEHCQQKHVDEE